MESRKDNIWLPPDKKELFELLLRDRGIDLPELHPIPRSDPGNLHPLSPEQERLWNLSRNGSVDELQAEFFLLRIFGRLSVPALTCSLNEIVRRHEILRTRFVVIADEPRQVVSARTLLAIPTTDLTGMPESERETIGRALAREQVTRGFNLERLPLIRARVIDLSDQEQLFVMSLHQMVCDGPSRKILAKELTHLYTDFGLGRQSSLPEPALQYGDVAEWVRKRLKSGELDRDTQYWREELKGGLPSMAQIADRTGPARPTGRGAGCEVKLTPELSRQIRKISATESITPFMTLLAVWQVLLARFSGQEQVTVTVPVANRTRVETQSVTGPLWSRVVMKLDLSDNPTFKEVISRVREKLVRAFEHQELPYGQTLVRTGDQRGPLVEATFVKDEGIGEIKLSGLKVTEERLETHRARSDLGMVFREKGESYEGEIEYMTELFDENKIKLMARGYEKLMGFLVYDLGCHIRNLPPLVD